MITKKEMREKIKEYKDGLLDGEFKTGRYIKKVGYKWVHVLDTWESSTIEKISIEEFYNLFEHKI